MDKYRRTNVWRAVFATATRMDRFVLIFLIFLFVQFDRIRTESNEISSRLASTLLSVDFVQISNKSGANASSSIKLKINANTMRRWRNDTAWPEWNSKSTANRKAKFSDAFVRRSINVCRRSAAENSKVEQTRISSSVGRTNFANDCFSPRSSRKTTISKRRTSANVVEKRSFSTKIIANQLTDYHGLVHRSIDVNVVMIAINERTNDRRRRYTSFLRIIFVTHAFWTTAFFILATDYKNVHYHERKAKIKNGKSLKNRSRLNIRIKPFDSTCQMHREPCRKEYFLPKEETRDVRTRGEPNEPEGYLRDSCVFWITCEIHSWWSNIGPSFPARRNLRQF